MAQGLRHDGEGEVRRLANAQAPQEGSSKTW